MSTQFLKIGNSHINVSDIREITVREDGGLIVELVHAGMPLKVEPGEDAANALDWLNSLVYKGGRHPHVKTASAEPEKTETKAPARRTGQDYDAWTVEELHAEATHREIEGRSALTTHDDLVKALRKADKKK